MSRLRVSVLAVVLLVALAGCNGVVDGLSDGPSEQNRDTYDVGEPLEPSLSTPTPAPDEDAPSGISADAVYDLEELWAEHRAQLDGRSYSAYVESVARDANGSEVYAVEQRSEFDYNASWHYIVEETRGNLSLAYSARRSADPGSIGTHLSDADAVTVEHWFDPRSPYQRIEAENGSVTHVVGFEIPVLPGDWRLRNSLPAVENATVDRREYREGAYYVVSAEEVDPRSEFVADEPFSLTLFVAPDGLIEHYRLEGTVRVDGRDLRIVEGMSLSDVGETAVERPDWYEAALEGTDRDTPTDERGSDDDEETPTDGDGSTEDDTPSESDTSTVELTDDVLRTTERTSDGT